MLLAEIGPAVAQAQNPPPATNGARAPAVTIQECRSINDSDVRQRVRELTETVLRREVGQIDYANLVDKHWRDVNMNSRIDAEVDEAIRLARAQTNIVERAYSTVS